MKLNKTNWPIFLRIMIPLFIMLKFSTILFDYDLFFSCNSLVNAELSSIHAVKFVPTIFQIKSYFNLPECSEIVNYSFISLYFLFLIFTIIGFFTRTSVLLVLFFTLILNNSLELYIYGVDLFLIISLFYLLLVPSNYLWSVDKRLFKLNSNPQFINLILKIFQVHLCIAYFFGGFDKLLGINWRNGESLWKALHLVECPNLINVEQISTSQSFYLTMGWATIILELLYPVMANFKFSRKYWIVGIISMHLFIGIFLGLFFFALVMIILNITLFVMPYIKHKTEDDTAKAYKI